MDQVFDNLDRSENQAVQAEARLPHHVIQKRIILDQIQLLVDDLERWVEDGGVTAQFLRFYAHLLLFLEQVALLPRREVLEKAIEWYVMLSSLLILIKVLF